jgi:hypothetical protein
VYFSGNSDIIDIETLVSYVFIDADQVNLEEEPWRKTCLD